VAIHQPNLPGDNKTRIVPDEMHVYRVQARLAKWKQRIGRRLPSGVQDDTLNYGDEGANPPIPPTGHSFIGEVPDPHCFSGADGTNMSDSSNVRSSSRKRNVFEGKWQFNQSNFQDERNPAIDYAKFRQPIT